MNRLSSSLMLEDIKTEEIKPVNIKPTVGKTATADNFLHEKKSQSIFSAEIQNATEHPEICSVFTPLHYEPNYAYPLLVWLHGEGENEGCIRRVMPKISMRNYVATAPCGTVSLGHQQHSSGNDGFTWSLNNRHTSAAMERIYMAIERAEQRFNVDSSRIFLAGIGSGGTMALQIGMTIPEHFAGIVSVGGPLPREDALLAHLHQSRELPLLLMVDRENQHYPDSMVCEDLRLLHIAGMTVTLRQYPAGDAFCDSMLSDVDQWLMEVLANVQKAPVVVG